MPLVGIDAHLFATADLRGVLRDITLDGNTFSSSHHIEKRRWVSEFGLGFSMRAGAWKLAIARYIRSRGVRRSARCFGLRCC